MKKFTLALIILHFLAAIPAAKAQSQFWGMTSRGGDGYGTIFKTDGIGNNYQVMETFDPSTPGINPYGTMCEMPNGKFLGTTYYDGVGAAGGVLFEYDPATNMFIKKIDFAASTGDHPVWSLLKASNGKIYSAASYGGINNKGTIFEYDYVTNIYTKKFDFDGINGHPQSGIGGFIQASNGKLYGATSRGGATDHGVLFEYDYITNTYTKLFDFASATGSNPLGPLTQAANSKLYGTTANGGANGEGVLFEYDLATSTYTVKVNFSYAIGRNPNGNLTEVTNGKLYGITPVGGINNGGTIFEYDYVTNTYTQKINLTPFTMGNSGGFMMKALNGKLYGATGSGGPYSTGVIFEYDYSTNTYTKKADFNGVNGSDANGNLVQATNGKLYGTTSNGGIGGDTHSSGVIFEFDYNTGILTKKIDLDLSMSGSYPSGSLMKAANGKLYGVTNGGGGAHGLGTIFEYNVMTNTFIKKIDLDSTTGFFPVGSLMEAPNGKLYGMLNYGVNYLGALFEYDYNTNACIKKIDLVPATGVYPSGSLMLASNGKVYGMTTGGLPNNDGAIFEYNFTTNTYTKKIDVNSFGTGSRPVGNLVQAPNGKLYGMTGVGDFGVSSGWIFEYDYTTNTYTKKVDFSDSLGRDAEGSLVVGANGKLFGMTSDGGQDFDGVLFEYDPMTNSYAKKYDFNDANGKWPTGSLMQASNGKLYGMTSRGGTYNEGVMFEFDYNTNTYIKKTDLNGTNGSTPMGALIEIASSVTAVGRKTVDDKINIYPNPSNGVFTIKYPASHENITLTVTSALGTIVYSATTKDISGECFYAIDLSKQAKGVYFMELIGDGERHLKKLIVE